MNKPDKTREQLLDELQEITSRMMDAEDTLKTILSGEIDGLVINTPEGDRVFTLTGANHPYRVMVETMNEGAVTLDSDGTILYSNQRFADIVKQSLDEVIGSSICQYSTPENIEIFKAFVELGTTRTGSVELVLKTGSDILVPVLLSVSNLQQADVPDTMCVLVADLTSQKRNEKILAEEKLTTQIFHQAAEIFILCDPQGFIIRASQSTTLFLGNSPILKAFDNVFHLSRPDGDSFRLLSEIDDKSLLAVEVEAKNRDNQSVFFLLSASPLFQDKDIIGIIVDMVDITERKNLEKVLQDSHFKLEEQVKARTSELAAALEEASGKKQIAEAAVLEIKKLKNLLEAERGYLQEEIKLTYNHEHIIGQSDGIKYVLFKVEQIAKSDTIVLVLGETGTGKELIARAVHNLSSRKNRALVKVNCAALPATLIESELFGHEKGSFTGSLSRHIGRFEIANGSTIFLDEIGELPIELQAKLLRVIQDGEFERLGSSRTIKVDTRIIAATNRNLEAEVKAGNFREDLFYRFNVFPITLPPLRDRLDDIPFLVDFYVKKISRRMGKIIETIPTGVMAALQDYHWPGNIRELENVLERAVINSSSAKLRLADELERPHTNVSFSQKTMEAVEREHILQTLEQTGWKVGGKDSAAEILGLDRSTLRARMRKLGIQKS
jgi:chemotaxis protein methyltransferase CheR